MTEFTVHEEHPHLRCFYDLLVHSFIAEHFIGKFARDAITPSPGLERSIWFAYCVVPLDVYSASASLLRFHLNCKRFYWYLFRYFRLLFVCQHSAIGWARVDDAQQSTVRRVDSSNIRSIIAQSNRFYYSSTRLVQRLSFRHKVEMPTEWSYLE